MAGTSKYRFMTTIRIVTGDLKIHESTIQIFDHHQTMWILDRVPGSQDVKCSHSSRWHELSKLNIFASRSFESTPPPEGKDNFNSRTGDSDR
jgi:hypothetical protein